MGPEKLNYILYKLYKKVGIPDIKAALPREVSLLLREKKL